jgi:DeoR/GlpR family transcriptional regulator of sugar metabolism
MSQTLLGVQVPFVSIAEAGKVLGVAEITIRRRLRSGEIKGHKRSTPQGYVWIVELSEEDLQRNREHEEENGNVDQTPQR